MGFFNKKIKVEVDINQKFKALYKDINQIIANANSEGDIEIRVSLLVLANEKYVDLLALIDQGADFEKEHFLALKKSVEKDIMLNKGL